MTEERASGADERLFDRLLQGTRKEGVDKLIEWLHTTDFYTAPASSKYHLCREGGLLEHSINVYMMSMEQIQGYRLCDIAGLDMCCLLHDVCKIGLYEPVDGGYRYNKEVGELGHGSRSVELIEQFIKLTPEEEEAIRYHMGLWDCDDKKLIGDVYHRNTMAWVLHAADEAATFVEEKD